MNRNATEIPTFWPTDPKICFHKIKNQFAIAGIVDDTKFHYVVANLDAPYITEVRDISARPPEIEKYNKIKTELYHRNKRFVVC